MKWLNVRFATTAILLGLALTTAHAQDAGSSPAPQSQDSASQPSQPAQKPSQNQGKPGDSSTKNLPDKVQPAPDDATKNAQNPKRIFGIIPNFISTNDTTANEGPLTVHEKYILSLHQMFDVSAHIGNLLQSAVSQAANGQPHYGQGWGAFGERFEASEDDQMTSSLFIYGVLPSVLHDDPRYFRRLNRQPSLVCRITHRNHAKGFRPADLQCAANTRAIDSTEDFHFLLPGAGPHGTRRLHSVGCKSRLQQRV